MVGASVVFGSPVLIDSAVAIVSFIIVPSSAKTGALDLLRTWVGFGSLLVNGSLAVVGTAFSGSFSIQHSFQ